MSKHGYTLKYNDEAMSQNQRMSKLIFLRAVLRWCQERAFTQNCAEWIPYGQERINAIEALGTLKNSQQAGVSSQVPERASASVIRPSKTKPCTIALV